MSPAIWVLGAVSCSVRRAFHAEEVRWFEYAKSVLASWVVAASFSISHFSLQGQLWVHRLVVPLLGPPPSSFGLAFGLLVAGVIIAVLGSGLFSLLGYSPLGCCLGHSALVGCL